MRPSGWDVLGLDGDPTPGVVEAIQALAKEFGDFSHDVEQAWSSLKSFGGDATALSWVGQTADAFKNTFGPLPGRLQKLYISYGEASDALSAYWPKMQAAQNKADLALRQGQDAEVDVSRANGTANNAAADLKTAQAGTDPKAAADAQTTHDNAQKALTDAKGRLAALTAAAHQAHNDLDAAAKECAKALHHAQSDGIHNKHWWQHVGEALSDVGGKIAEWANDIGQIAQILAPILNGIALLTAEVPGLDVVTAGLAVADDFIAETAPEVATAGLAIKAAGDGLQGHWDDLAHDAAYLGASRMGGKGGKEGEDGVPPGAMAAHDGRQPVGDVNDPAFDHGPLGDDFKPGVHDPGGQFKPHEVPIAERLKQEGHRVDQRPEDQTIQGDKNPDAMVRKAPDDPGTITEFKKLNSGSLNAIKRNMNTASGQVPADGEVVIDGRGVGLTEADARAAYNGALHQSGSKVAKVIHVILGDDSIISFPRSDG
ncbi:putative T7SS-secreted protein [Catenulispora rubra]|uniref:putative T7SS-secreted protein n=1 Tax=Catenulispora rubra TaxID=280293 RepID=UPI001892776E|nr:hypothetical protein [Catenulispora rubra]